MGINDRNRPLLSASLSLRKDNLARCEDLLQHASTHLQILDLDHGEEELVKSVAAELAKLTAFMAESSKRQ